MPYISKNKVRMHDTDMAGILYFPRIYRFAHDALEDFIESEGMTFEQVFRQEKFVFVIVHSEADYYIPMKVGDPLEIHLYIERIGNTSFSIAYKIYREANKELELVGAAKTIHVCLESTSRTKIPIPEKMRASLTKYLIQV